MEYIAFDCHKRYTWAVVKDEQGRLVREHIYVFIKFGGAQNSAPFANSVLGNHGVPHPPAHRAPPDFACDLAPGRSDRHTANHPTCPDTAPASAPSPTSIINDQTRMALLMTSPSGEHHAIRARRLANPSPLPDGPPGAKPPR